MTARFQERLRTPMGMRHLSPFGDPEACVLLNPRSSNCVLKHKLTSEGTIWKLSVYGWSCIKGPNKCRKQHRGGLHPRTKGSS